MAHAHPHRSHTGHGTQHASGNERRTLLAAALTGGFMLAEAIGGLIAGSLALLADAAHMLIDSVALALAWFAFRLARRPADWQRTYGFERLQILTAFANGITLILITAFILIEAVQRLFEPVEVMGGTMLAVAMLGLVVNVAAFLALHGADRRNLNIKGALLHVMGDLLGSLAAIAAAIVILTTGWTPIDPILSVLVCALILRTAWRLVRESGHILLEGAPRDVDVAEIAPDLEAHLASVLNVHHVHAWSLTPQKPMVTLHARIAHSAAVDQVAAAIKERLRARFGIAHTTIQLERDACLDQPNSLSG